MKSLDYVKNPRLLSYGDVKCGLFSSHSMGEDGSGKISMTYLKCSWNHSFPDAPITLYSELDDQRWELRKVEVFRDGTMGYADRSKEVGGSMLGLEPVPALAEIATDPQFQPVEISSVEFESVWNAAAAAHASQE